jgi:hypothetical protein
VRLTTLIPALALIAVVAFLLKVLLWAIVLSFLVKAFNGH